MKIQNKEYNQKLFINYLLDVIPAFIEKINIYKDEITIFVKPNNLHNILIFLHKDYNCLCKSLVDITAVDYPEQIKRFEIIYNLLSFKYNFRLRIKILLEENENIESVVGIFKGANWLEREVYDMFGIFFINHPDLRRILTDYGFEGYPLRKDFPLSGFIEIRYDDEAKRIVYDALEITQEFRNFDFLSPWEKP
jgi:NADH dehydrogenase (ubiquinone) Fe-S protein 3